MTKARAGVSREKESGELHYAPLGHKSGPFEGFVIFCSTCLVRMNSIPRNQTERVHGPIVVLEMAWFGQSKRRILLGMVESEKGAEDFYLSTSFSSCIL